MDTLPGWNASIGGVTTPVITYDNLSTGGAGVSLLDPSQLNINANYTVVLQGSGFARDGAVSLQQTGVVPSGANSIQFLSLTSPYRPQSVVVFGLNVNGQPISLVPLSEVGNVWTYGANISPFAGRSASLDFYSLSGVSGGNFYLNDISFSAQVIPEPGVLALFGITGLALVLNLQRTRGGWLRRGV